MTISAPDFRAPSAVAVCVSEDALIIELSDGRSVTAPLAWYPRLLHATKAERDNFRLIGGGSGIHWPDVEEDISIHSVLSGRPSMETSVSLKRWLDERSVRA